MSNSDYLADLNESQREAVVSQAKSLQIIAGPGSGKTRVLTTRVAWLVKEKGLRPSSIVVVTFTKKAAREMAERLEQPHILGEPRSNYLRMGTFHSFCSRLLRRHVEWTTLKPNFVVADESKSKHLIDTIVKELKDKMLPINKDKKPADFRNFINDAKGKGIDHHTFMGLHGNSRLKKDTAMVYTAYEEKLEQANMIDFNGILLKARDLLRGHPAIVDYVTHVLVDEYQDTNSVQYELLLLLTGRGAKPITIVGDPDQSIFGWRFADKKNFHNMELDFKGTVVVNLKQNYRSTKSILTNATHVVSLDTKRKEREFYTDNHEGVPISTLHTESEVDEARVVAKEIKRIIKFSNGLVNYKDIAVLFRMNFLTCTFEQALLRERVPFVVVSGTRFLDRMEIKDVLAYLSFFYNPMDTGAFVRLINAPKRGLGDTTVKKMLALTASKNWTLIETIQRLVDHHAETASIRISGKARSGLQSILTLHLEIVERMQRMESPANLLSWIVDSVGYMEHLEKNHEKDHESREQNVKELIDYAHRHTEDIMDAENIIDPVGQFLETVTLCGDAKEHDDAKEGKVSLITIHGAKGLEWKAVFVAGCEQGIVPMVHTDDPDEECRLMYVAMTRAKCFLYCTTASRRLQWGKTLDTVLSSFLTALPTDGYQTKTPAWNAEVRRWVAQVLRVSYVEDDNLQLEDAGREYNRIDTGFNEYDHYSYDYDHYEEDYNHYGDDNYYGDSYDENDHFRDYGSANDRRDSYPTNNSRNTANLPGICSASSLLHQLLLPASTSASSKNKKHTTKPINIKAETDFIPQQRQQQSGSAPIKVESSSQPKLHPLFQRQTSADKIKLEPVLTTMDSVTKKQKRKAINIKKEHCTNITTITSFSIPQKKQKHGNTTAPVSLDQCVRKGLQLVGIGKSFFTKEDAIAAVQTQVPGNQWTTISPSNIEKQVDEQLDCLVQKGSLFRHNKGGIARFYMVE